MAYPEPLEQLVQAFERFPGIGRRTAERLSFHVLRDADSRKLGQALEHCVRNTMVCRACGNVADSDPCELCSDEERDASLLCVVEGPRDVESMERAGVYRGRYHVLMGAFNPAEGNDARHLAVNRLAQRVREESIAEVILATDPDAEGEATALLALEALESAQQEQALVVTRLARGMPAGSAIEYLHRGVLEDALEGRRAVGARTRPDVSAGGNALGSDSADGDSSANDRSADKASAN